MPARTSRDSLGDSASFVDHLCLLCFHARLFVDALWSPSRKGLTSWLSFDAVRKDRASDADGGVFIAFKRDLLCTETPELDTNCEIVWCKLNIIGFRTLYLAWFLLSPMSVLRSLTHPYLGLCRIETLMFWLEEISIAAT